MPTRNRGAFITRAIRSILLQTFADWELIIVDDGSTDATSQIVQAFLGDERIRYVTNVRCGAASARNRGIELSRGRFIAYLDSDNIFYPDFLAHAVKFFLGNEFADIGYGILTSNEHDASGFFYFSGFDRNELLKANYIDLNCVIHRKTLVDAYGVFDEALTRLLDWDLILRYTTEKPAYPLPVLAAAYQTDAANRITTEYAFADNAFKIRRKWRAQIGRATPLRVLYVLWHYPQLSETYLETEIQCMRRWGVQVEVWRSTSQQAAPYMSETPVHDGRLEDAVRAFQPHIVHTHWLGFTLSQQERLEATNLPVTVRLHGFDTTRDGLRELLNKKWVRRVYGFPAHLTLLDEEDHRLKIIQVGFESTRFFPKFNKNRRNCSG